jgi:predicted transposase/invertase (TIGR01784 family)
MEKKIKSSKKGKVPKAKKLKSDALFKLALEDTIIAKEFLQEYLPKDLQDRLNIETVKVEKESYVEPNLRRQLSDLVYSVKTKSDEEAFVYVLLEHQSKVDHLMALRLWKYMLLLCERHSKNKAKLPLIVPIVVYNGKEKYTAARDLWQLFADPVKARELMTGEYKLIDLQAMPDNEITRKKQLGMFEFFLKHVHQRDMIKLWEDFFQSFGGDVVIKWESGFIYIKRLLCYTEPKVLEEERQKLANLITDNLTEDGEEMMRSMADAYIEEGYYKGVEEGIEKGREEGREEGMEIAAIKMLQENFPLGTVSKITGVPENKLVSLMKKV